MNETAAKVWWYSFLWPIRLGPIKAPYAIICLNFFEILNHLFSVKKGATVDIIHGTKASRPNGLLLRLEQLLLLRCSLQPG